MNMYALTPAQAALAIQHIDDRDWCPPGGTSSRRYDELSSAWHAAFEQELTRRIAERGTELWIKTLDHAIHIGWHNLPDSDYFVGHGLEHLHHLPEDQLRSFCYLAYTDPETGEVAPPDSNIGDHYFESPYTNDTVLHVDHVMAWLDAHHRTWRGAVPPAPSGGHTVNDPIAEVLGELHNEVRTDGEAEALAELSERAGLVWTCHADKCGRSNTRNAEVCEACGTPGPE